MACLLLIPICTYTRKMSVFHSEAPRHARPKVDLRLAESYLPALVLCVKCIAYTTIAPIILLMQWRLTVLCVSAFALLLFVDHLYLSYGPMPFIDSTALCLDVFGCTLLMLAISLLRPCSQQCQGVLALWTVLGAVHVLLMPVGVPRAAVHACAFTLALLFIYADTGSATALATATNGVLNQTLFLPLPSPPLPFSFFLRTTLYVLLSLVDIYLFRPPFQQENERLLFCRYAPVLLGSWPWYFVFWLLLGMAQLTRHVRLHSPTNNSQSSSSSTSHSGGNHNNLKHARASPVSQGQSSAISHHPHLSCSSSSSSSLPLYSSNHHHLPLPFQNPSAALHMHHTTAAAAAAASAYHPHSNSSSSSSSHAAELGMQSQVAASSSGAVHHHQELDIMEAFRLAKEQHMGAKGAN
jgi:hypothetical protein